MEAKKPKKDVDDDTELDTALKAQDMTFTEKTTESPAVFLMKQINHNGDVVEKTLVQHLTNRNYA